jgi:hypothetical protein
MSSMAMSFTLAELIMKETLFQENITWAEARFLILRKSYYWSRINRISFFQCHVSFGGGEHSKMDDIEVLTSPNGANLVWTVSNSLPGNAIPGGRSNERQLSN